MTLGVVGNVCNCSVPHHVSVVVQNRQRFSYTRSMQMVSLQCELLNVNVNQVVEKMILYTGGRLMVSHHCELLDVCANQMTEKTTCHKKSS
jgi:hypothetical protein